VVSLYDLPATALGGGPADLRDHEGRAVLIVNVASRCGLTSQYGGLQRLAARYRARGFEVLGFPCNQFLGQEPGSSEEIAEFCSATYGVDFPMFDKVEVNGEDRHPLFAELTTVPDAEGYTGDVRWNFEKWVVAPGRHLGHAVLPAGGARGPRCRGCHRGGAAGAGPTGGYGDRVRPRSS